MNSGSQQILDNYEYTKYACNSVSEVMDKLRDYGVAILPNVLDTAEIEAMRTGMWDYLEWITADFPKPIRRDDPTTWRELRQLYPKHSMLIQQWSVGHAQFIWDLRQNPKIAQIFSQIWNVPEENLITSFDGASFHMPPETTGTGWFRGKSWLHTDQSYLRNSFECIQSWITAYDVNPGDATLTFLEGSHGYHDAFRDRFEIKDKSDWFMLETPEHYDFYMKEHGCQQKYIQCPAVSMVFWDSRTIHCGQEAIRNRAKPNMRCVAYICMTARSKATPKILEKKQKAFHEVRTTNHWPHKPKLFPTAPRTYGQPLPQVRPLPVPQLNELGRRLAGFD